MKNCVSRLARFIEKAKGADSRPASEKKIWEKIQKDTFSKRHTNDHPNLSSCFSDDSNAAKKDGMDMLDVGDLLVLISSIHHQAAQVKKVGELSVVTTSDAKGNIHINRVLRILMKEYLRRVREQLNQWLSRTIERDCELWMNREGKIVTTLPEDIFHVFSSQIEVSSKYLPEEMQVELLLVCFEELRIMQKNIRASLFSEWHQMNVEELCAVVNDSCMFYEESFSFAADAVGIPPSQQTAELKVLTNEICQKFAELAAYASSLISHCLMEDLRAPVISLVLSRKWERTELAYTVVLTIRDYFQDLVIWIPYSFFSKCVRKCFEQVLLSYVESVIVNGKQSCKNVGEIGKRMQRDSLILLRFFGGECAQHLKASGLSREPVELRIEVIRSLSNILLATRKDDIMKEVGTLKRELGAHHYIAAALLMLRMKGLHLESGWEAWKSGVQHVEHQSPKAENQKIDYDILPVLHHRQQNQAVHNDGKRLHISGLWVPFRKKIKYKRSCVRTNATLNVLHKGENKIMHPRLQSLQRSSVWIPRGQKPLTTKSTKECAAHLGQAKRLSLALELMPADC